MKITRHKTNATSINKQYPLPRVYIDSKRLIFIDEQSGMGHTVAEKMAEYCFNYCISNINICKDFKVSCMSSAKTKQKLFKQREVSVPVNISNNPNTQLPGPYSPIRKSRIRDVSFPLGEVIRLTPYGCIYGIINFFLSLTALLETIDYFIYQHCCSFPYFADMNLS